VSQPVVHFEVIGKDPKRLREYFGELFGWEFNTPSPVAPEVSEPESDGILDLVTSDDGTGIRGGVGAGRVTQATLSFTLVCRTSRQRCSELKASEAHG
jgi:uncharacterized protein